MSRVAAEHADRLFKRRFLMSCRQLSTAVSQSKPNGEPEYGSGSAIAWPVEFSGAGGWLTASALGARPLGAPKVATSLCGMHSVGVMATVL